MDYSLMDTDELQVEFLDLLYWLYESGVDSIEFKEENASVFVFPKDVTMVGFSTMFYFEK